MPIGKCFRDQCPTPVQDVFKICLACQRPFCSLHEGADNDYCMECSEPPAELSHLESKPLIDEEGVKKTGRELVPVGDYWVSTAGSIAEMSDEELDRFILKYKALVKEAEMMKDRRQVTLNMMEYEKGERSDSKIRRLRGIKVANRQGPAKVNKKNETNGDKPMSGTDIASTLGVDSFKDLAAMILLAKHRAAEAKAKKS